MIPREYFPGEEFRVSYIQDELKEAISWIKAEHTAFKRATLFIKKAQSLLSGATPENTRATIEKLKKHLIDERKSLLEAAQEKEKAIIRSRNRYQFLLSVRPMGVDQSVPSERMNQLIATYLAKTGRTKAAKLIESESMLQNLIVTQDTTTLNTLLVEIREGNYQNAIQWCEPRVNQNPLVARLLINLTMASMWTTVMKAINTAESQTGTAKDRSLIMRVVGSAIDLHDIATKSEEIKKVTQLAGIDIHTDPSAVKFIQFTTAILKRDVDFLLRPENRPQTSELCHVLEIAHSLAEGKSTSLFETFISAGVVALRTIECCVNDDLNPSNDLSQCTSPSGQQDRFQEDPVTYTDRNNISSNPTSATYGTHSEQSSQRQWHQCERAGSAFREHQAEINPCSEYNTLHLDSLEITPCPICRLDSSVHLPQPPLRIEITRIIDPLTHKPMTEEDEPVALPNGSVYLASTISSHSVDGMFTDVCGTGQRFLTSDIYRLFIV